MGKLTGRVGELLKAEDFSGKIASTSIKRKRYTIKDCKLASEGENSYSCCAAIIISSQYLSIDPIHDGEVGVGKNAPLPVFPL